ncbi:MAG: bifunctional (p)ppGpp synthetase/guanosine-3',5'-bis(diphosphate) 3'-pyrophosphohydrolase [Nitrospira sp.]|nr:bifunctional (p)ppGpp synthetase/guanosine-3',5'-bis(diphosphate) 3'-pyrophosphohydrolase [Nitrospira sp.]MCA9480404.1 bifunctional (p)ppGpp synthetase/guanosine-3',5'-bis(diphosphate) 3'-pyrophosphohydrolase [Nitrospira sp.]
MGNIPLILKALAFAADKHRNQRRLNVEASPYINHPIELAKLLSNEGGITSSELLSAALLHDTIEDTQTTREELQEQFGAGITAIVMEVTDDKTLPKAVRKRLQIEHAGTISAQAKLVKLADKICNLRDMDNSPPAKWPIERRREYFDWAKQVVDQLRGAHAALEALFDAAYAKRP